MSDEEYYNNDDEEKDEREVKNTCDGCGKNLYKGDVYWGNNQYGVYCEECAEKDVEVVCAVNLVQRGGEFTLCGNAIPDTTIKDDNCEHVGNEFIGRLKDVTCRECLKFIRFIKDLN